MNLSFSHAAPVKCIVLVFGLLGLPQLAGAQSSLIDSAAQTAADIRRYAAYECDLAKTELSQAARNAVAKARDLTGKIEGAFEKVVKESERQTGAKTRFQPGDLRMLRDAISRLSAPVELGIDLAEAAETVSRELESASRALPRCAGNDLDCQDNNSVLAAAEFHQWQSRATAAVLDWNNEKSLVSTAFRKWTSCRYALDPAKRLIDKANEVVAAVRGIGAPESDRKPESTDEPAVCPAPDDGYAYPDGIKAGCRVQACSFRSLCYSHYRLYVMRTPIPGPEPGTIPDAKLVCASAIDQKSNAACLDFYTKKLAKAAPVIDLDKLRSDLTSTTSALREKLQSDAQQLGATDARAAAAAGSAKDKYDSSFSASVSQARADAAAAESARSEQSDSAQSFRGPTTVPSASGFSGNRQSAGQGGGQLICPNGTQVWRGTTICAPPPCPAGMKDYGLNSYGARECSGGTFGSRGR